jgi:hypothetical protein
MRHQLFVLFVFAGLVAGAAAAEPPDPRSEVLTGIEFHQETLVRSAPGSDIWACTCDPNGVVYATWGDGGGFGGTDSEGRASIGVARITGVPPAWKGMNLWGGLAPASNQPPTLGKGTLIAIKGRLYLYVSEQGTWNRCRLWRSADEGLSWADCGWLFPRSHKAFAFPGLVQYGGAQASKANGYVYGFSDNDRCRVKDNYLYLFRVRQEQIEDRAAYEYFCGTVEAPRCFRPEKCGGRQAVYGDSRYDGMSTNPMAFLSRSGGTGPVAHRNQRGRAQVYSHCMGG